MLFLLSNLVTKVHLCVYLFIYLSIYLPVCLSDCVCLSQMYCFPFVTVLFYVLLRAGLTVMLIAI